MPKGNISSVTYVSTIGDLNTVFKQLNVVLNDSNSKLVIPLNLAGRRNKRLSTCLLEVLVESRDVNIDWKLKLGNINITRKFKPSSQVYLEPYQTYLHKFIYDVTSILNTPEMLEKEWIQLVIKHEGGSPFRLKAIVLDAIYEDNDAYTEYEHVSGLLLLGDGEEHIVKIRNTLQKSSTLRLILYSPRGGEVYVTMGHGEQRLLLTQNEVEEYVVPVDNIPETIKIKAPKEGIKSHIVISSVTTYRNIVKAPILEVCSINYTRTGHIVKLKLGVCNKGVSQPDKFIISILRRGMLIRSLVVENPLLPPGGVIERELELPLDKPEDLVARLIWVKGSKRWFQDTPIRLGTQ